MKAVRTESHDQIEATAADFLQRRRFGNWNADEQSEFDTWLDESEARRIAYWRLQAGLDRIERLAALRTSKPKPKERAARLRFMVPFLAAAAALGSIALFGPRALEYFLQPPDRTYSTDVGGRTLLTFADNTQIELNTDSAVRYRMTTAERTVWLDKGEAFFRVAHDAAHPFTVIVGKHRVTDLGTEFLVRREPGRMEVALLRGRATLSTEGAQTATLNPGDDAVATPTAFRVTTKSPEELADELAWRRGLLIFRNARLADAVREFNRYNRTKLVIADPSIANLKFTVEIRDNNFEDFLQLAQTVLKLRVDREGNDVLLYRATARDRGARTHDRANAQ